MSCVVLPDPLCRSYFKKSEKSNGDLLKFHLIPMILAFLKLVPHLKFFAKVNFSSKACALSFVSLVLCSYYVRSVVS